MVGIVATLTRTSTPDVPAAFRGAAIFPGIPAVLLLTGIQAAGKSTVAQLIAERLPRSAHVRGDVFRRMVVGGRAEMTPEGSPEALRHGGTAHARAARCGGGGGTG